MDRKVVIEATPTRYFTIQNHSQLLQHNTVRTKRVEFYGKMKVVSAQLGERIPFPRMLLDSLVAAAQEIALVLKLKEAAARGKEELSPFNLVCT